MSLLFVAANFLIATRSIRASWWFSNIVVVSAATMLAVAAYDYVHFLARAETFAEDFVEHQARNVRIHDGLTLLAVRKAGSMIVYSYWAADGAPVPGVEAALANNCAAAPVRLLLEIGYTVVHRFDFETDEDVEIRLERRDCPSLARSVLR